MHGVDELNDAYDVRLKHYRLNALRQMPGFTFEQVDIAQRSSIEALLPYAKDCAAVFNLAARAGVRYSTENPWTYVDANVFGTVNTLELCRAAQIPKYILASTSSLYGNEAQPFSELTPTDKVLSPYAASKKGAESMAGSYHHMHNIDVSVLRYFTVYGPAGRPDMSIFRFVQWLSEGRPVTIYGDGEQRRDFTFVGDIARGTIAALKPVGFDVFNLGSDGPISVNRALQLIADAVGKPAHVIYQPAHKADVQATWANIAKAKAVLGWSPEVSFDKGIALAVSWYQREREWARDIATS